MIIYCEINFIISLSNNNTNETILVLNYKLIDRSFFYTLYLLYCVKWQNCSLLRYYLYCSCLRRFGKTNASAKYASVRTLLRWTLFEVTKTNCSLETWGGVLYISRADYCCSDEYRKWPLYCYVLNISPLILHFISI